MVIRQSYLFMVGPETIICLNISLTAFQSWDIGVLELTSEVLVTLTNHSLDTIIILWLMIFGMLLMP